jgi:hypothetical protein
LYQNNKKTKFNFLNKLNHTREIDYKTAVVVFFKNQSHNAKQVAILFILTIIPMLVAAMNHRPHIGA